MDNMDIFLRIFMVVSLVGPEVFLFLAWPSRLNAPVFIAVGLAIPQYVLPVLSPELTAPYSQELCSEFTAISAVGAGFFLFGTLLGRRIRSPWLSPFLYSAKSTIGSELVVERSVKVTFVGVLLLVASFLYMGFLPMFADNPLEAKYFRGEY